MPEPKQQGYVQTGEILHIKLKKTEQSDANPLKEFQLKLLGVEDGWLYGTMHPANTPVRVSAQAIERIVVWEPGADPLPAIERGLSA